MSTEKTEQSTALTESSSMDTWLDAAIQLKRDKNQLVFDEDQDKLKSETENTMGPELENGINSPINLSLYGIKKPNDINVFLSSHAGHTVIEKIAERKSEERAEEEQRQFEQREEEKSHNMLKVMLMLWLLDEEGHAEQELRELIEKDNERAIQQAAAAANPKQQETSASKIDKAAEEFNQTMDSYKEKLNELDKKGTALSKEMNEIKAEQHHMQEKHKAYTASMEQLDSKADEYQKSPRKLKAAIKEKTKELNEVMDKIQTHDDFSPEGEAKLRELVRQQNALGSELEGLQDIKDKKRFYDNEGNRLSNAKNAAFAVGKDEKGKDQELIVKDGKKLLVPAGTKPEDLSKEDVAKYGKSFDDSKQRLMSIQSLVSSSVKAEKEFHEPRLSARVDEVQAQMDINSKEKMEIGNQIKSLESSRAAITNPVNNDLGQDTPKVAPSSSHGKVSSKATSIAAPGPINNLVDNLLPFFKRKTPPTSDEIVDELSKKPNKTQQESATLLQKMLKMLGNGRILSLAPLPQTTMNSLLQHNPRFGVDHKVGPANNEMGSALEDTKAPEMGTPSDSKEPKELQTAKETSQLLEVFAEVDKKQQASEKKKEPELTSTHSNTPLNTEAAPK